MAEGKKIRLEPCIERMIPARSLVGRPNKNCYTEGIGFGSTAYTNDFSILCAYYNIACSVPRHSLCRLLQTSMAVVVGNLSALTTAYWDNLGMTFIALA